MMMVTTRFLCRVIKESSKSTREQQREIEIEKARVLWNIFSEPGVNFFGCILKDKTKQKKWGKYKLREPRRGRRLVAVMWSPGVFIFCLLRWTIKKIKRQSRWGAKRKCLVCYHKGSSSRVAPWYLNSSCPAESTRPRLSTRQVQFVCTRIRNK